MKTLFENLRWRVYILCIQVLVTVRLALLTQVAIVRAFLDWLEPDLKRLAIWFLVSFYIMLIAFTFGNLLEMVWSVVASIADMIALLICASYLFKKGSFGR